MYNGYTKSTPEYIQRVNELQAIDAILQNDPHNLYWLNRRTTVEAKMVDIGELREALANVRDILRERLDECEQERQAAEAARIDEWLEPQTVEAATDAAYGTLDLQAEHADWLDEQRTREAVRP